MLDNGKLIRATAIGTALQAAMVLAGHFVPQIAALFAIGGMGFSLIAGIIYAVTARGGIGGGALGGAIAGGLCGLIGIAVSYLMGDVPMSLLAMGTAGSIVAGAIGGLVGAFLGRRNATA